MTFRNLIALSTRSFAGRKVAHLAPLLSVAMASSTTFVLLSIAWGVHRVGVSGLLSSLPITRLVATARQVEVLFLRVGTPLSSLEDSTLASIRRIKGVTAVWPEQVLTMPTSLMGDLLGTDFSTDCAVYGVSDSFFPPDQRPKGFTHRTAGEPIPVVLSSQLVDLYNSGFAGSQNLPGLSQKALVGRHFTLFLGTSSFLPAGWSDRVTSANCVIAGVSDLVSVTGVTVPDAYAKEWHAWYHGIGAPSRYASIHVEVASSDIVAEVRREIEARGLQVGNPRELAEKIALASQYVSAATAAIIALFLLLAGVGTGTTLGLEVTLQAERIGIYRSLGASGKDVLRIYFARAVILGVVGAVAGLAVAAGLLAVVGRWLGAFLPFVTRLPATWLELRPGLALVSFLLGAGASSVAGLVPARRAARLDPADALRSAET